MIDALVVRHIILPRSYRCRWHSGDKDHATNLPSMTEVGSKFLTSQANHSLELLSIEQMHEIAPLRPAANPAVFLHRVARASTHPTLLRQLFWYS